MFKNQNIKTKMIHLNKITSIGKYNIKIEYQLGKIEIYY